MSAEVEKGNFELFLSRYSSDRGLTEEEALNHAMIREVQKYYEEES